ncbi:serine/threonine-protein phosphatase 6 regulatory ankyrin repeat subunit A isoform X2 [Aplysia californica]|nr:serine/threonine-protein phosphatase 6 regulatory ankyrin repeat subunit A isoform X2 [Aplysia californica]
MLERNSPMHLATYYGNEQMLRFFIESGGDVNGQGVNLKRTPLHIAVMNNRTHCFQVLVAAGALLNLRDIFGNTACHYAAQSDRRHMLDILLHMGATINAQDISGKTPLMKAAIYNRIHCASRIMRINAEHNISDNNNETALHFAARHGASEIVQDLLAVGRCSQFVVNVWGSTPLMQAVENKCTQVVRVLMQDSCKVLVAKNTGKETGFQLAFRKGNPNIIETMLLEILGSVSNTLLMMRTHDWDFSEYTKALSEASGKEVSLFQLAVHIHSFPVCKALMKFGYADHRTRGELIQHVESLGDTESQEINDVLALLAGFREKPSLKHLCRQTVRRSMETNLLKKIQSLTDLPVPVLEYLSLKKEFEDVTAELNTS